MEIASAIVIFSLVWWVAFFMLLPVGVKRVENPAGGHATGAPAKTGLRWKAGAATLAAAMLTAISLWIITSGYWSIEEMLGVTDWRTWEQQHITEP